MLRGCKPDRRGMRESICLLGLHPYRHPKQQRHVLTDLECEVADIPLLHVANPNPGQVYAHRLVTEEGVVYARVVWFQWEGSTSTVDGGRAAEELRAWAGSADCVGDGEGGDGNPWTGVYVTLGTGALPGGGRHGPFSRKYPDRTDALEPVLSRLNSAVGCVLRESFTELCSHWLVDGTETEGAGAGVVGEGGAGVRWDRMLQYPRVLPGDHGPPAHQVVVRGHMSDDPPNLSVADLHTDSQHGWGR